MESTCIAIANEVLITTFARSHMDTALRFVAGDSSVVEVPPSKTGASKAWQRCQLALEASSDERSDEQMEQITKFSKGIHFFKYITNAQRHDLCKTMQFTQLKKNEIVMHGTNVNTEEHTNIWYVVIQGRVDMCVKTHAEGSTYRMCSFKEGDTFASSYMKMFQTSSSIQAHIEAATDTSCIIITIPGEYKNEFRTNTRPLWYEELAQYFHISINDAAEALGMCMSAIKKICRRHGISRWPHRKLASVNKTVAMLQSKINTADDDASRAALRSEAVNVLTMKLRLTINPSYLVRDESVLLQPAISMGGAGAGMPSGMPAIAAPMGAGAEGMPGGVDRGAGAPPGGSSGVDAILRQEQVQRTALIAQAEAQAAANAASVLQKVQNLNMARNGMGGPGDFPGAMPGMPQRPGGYGGGPPGGMSLQHMQDAMMQQRMMSAGHLAGLRGPGGNKDEDADFDDGDGFDDNQGGIRGPPGGMPGYPGMQHMPGYGAAGPGGKPPGPGFQPGAFDGRQRPPGGGPGGQPGPAGPANAQAMMMQQQRMMGIGQYGMGGFPGQPGGMLDDATMQKLAAQHGGGDLGKRHGVDAGGPDKRLRQH
mmetsp:Transcript_28233/g.44040  ORF Transcript_28233/g.44040 Transcript_28233/m.44040 type:complete len:594 (-) Transcript_28233:188-1969(-)